MNLRSREWKYFHLTGDNGIFDIENCKCSNASKLLEDGNDIQYIGAKKSSNGLMRTVKYNDQLVTKGNCIVLICDGQGSVGYTNYMEFDFIGSTTLSVGYNDNLNRYNAMFLVTILDLERYRYSYGRKYRSNLSEVKIKLPTTKEGTPDWEFMEEYIKQLNYKKITTENSVDTKKQLELNVDDWKEFYLHRIFNAVMGNGIDAGDNTHNNPKYNYVSRNSNDNGVVDFVDEIEGIPPFPAGSITIALGGSYLGSSFIQPFPFYTAQNVGVLLEKEPLSNAMKLFITTLIEKEARTKFQAFGRELNAHFRKDFILKLPIKKENGLPVIDNTNKYSDQGYIPDWGLMDKIIKSLPYGDRL